MNNKLLILIIFALILMPLFMMLERKVHAGWDPMIVNTNEMLLDVWGTSAMNVFAVGEGIIVNYDGDGDNDTVPDNNWDPPVTYPGVYYGVWGASATNVYAVGTTGAVWNYNGTNWTDATAIVLATGDLMDVWGTSGSDVFIVSSDGTIYHFDGTVWVKDISLAGQAFRAVWGSASDDVFAVSYTTGNIYHFNGSVWSTTHIGSSTFGLTNIWGSSASDIYAVGDLGTVLHYDGSNWSPITGAVTGTTNLTAVWGSSASDVFIMGRDGAIIHYDGTSWSDMASGIFDHLYGVWGSSANDVFAVGHSGTALRYAPDVTTTTTAPVTTTMPITTTTTAICSAELIYGGNSEEVALLRYIRDNVLSQTAEGREIIKLYYQWSSVVVKAMEEDKVFEAEVRAMIDGALLLIGE